MSLRELLKLKKKGNRTKYWTEKKSKKRGF